MPDQPTPPHDPARDLAIREPVQYPTNAVLGVVDAQAQFDALVDALLAGGFLPGEVRGAAGTAAADALATSTGRSGLIGIVARLATDLGLENQETEIKDRYEAALRDGQYVVVVEAPTEARRGRAVALLRDAGAHTVTYHGRFTIEEIIAPRDA